MPSEIKVVHGLQDGDIERVFAIEKDCFNPNYRWEASQLPEVEESLDFWLAYSGDKLAGFVAAQEDSGSACIENLAVLPLYRGKGIASRLIEEACKHFKTLGLKKSYLYVYVENPALKLYFDLGYRPTTISRGERKTMKMVKIL